jgi:uncharacterized protein YecT (DUF1311 family)
MNRKTWIALLSALFFTLFGTPAVYAAGPAPAPTVRQTAPNTGQPAPTVRQTAPPPTVRQAAPNTGQPAPATPQAAPRATKSAAASKPASPSPSFPCAKASNAVERAVCSDPVLAELDAHVAVEYKKALRLHADKAELKENQREWLRQMHSQCANAPLECAQQFYRLRLVQLLQHNE